MTFSIERFPLWSPSWIVTPGNCQPFFLWPEILSHFPFGQSSIVKVFTDKNAASISSKGRNSLCLHALALEIFAFCSAHDISLELEWIPRPLNSYADFISRVIDFDDWAVSTFFFHHVSNNFGPIGVDRFASSLSAKCARFYAKFCSSLL